MVHVAAITAAAAGPEVVRRMLTKTTTRRRRTMTPKTPMVNEKRTLLNMKWSIVIRATVMANAA